MHVYDVYEAPYQFCEIHSPLVRGSDSGVETLWPYSENVLLLW